MEKKYSAIKEEHVIQCYKRYAPFYDWLFGRILQPGRKAIVREVENLRPQEILEIGVGTGLMLPLYPGDIPVTGVDISLDMLKKAEEKICTQRQAQISLLEVNGECLPFSDNSFSCVVIPYTYSATPNPEKLIEEAKRVCQEDGTILIVNHFSGFKSIWNMLEKASKPLAKKLGFYSDFSYQKYVEDSGLDVINVYPVNLFGLSRVVIARA